MKDLEEQLTEAHKYTKELEASFLIVDKDWQSERKRAEKAEAEIERLREGLQKISEQRDSLEAKLADEQYMRDADETRMAKAETEIERLREGLREVGCDLIRVQTSSTMPRQCDHLLTARNRIDALLGGKRMKNE